MKNKVVVAEDLGKAIQDVIHFITLRGKFSSVHPELRQEGIVRVDIGEMGLHFVRDEGGIYETIEHLKTLVLGDSREILDSTVGREDEEEKLLKHAIALSMAEENDTEEEDNNEEDEELLQGARIER